MFFRLHGEGKIGYKQLSLADLGLGTSHQTHIGLYDDIFTYLHDTEVEEEALLIYNNNIDRVNCYFDRIENPDGSFRSPKIRKGERNSVSVVTVIRDKAKEYPASYRWYLIWFGLENEEMVFYFFNDHSVDFAEVSDILDLSRSGRIDYTNTMYDRLLNYLENKVNLSGKQIIEELEIASQVGTTKKYRPFDLDNANTLFKETGKKGEALVANYLDYRQSKNQIFNYTWYNKSMETGLPYDFSFQTKDQNVVYVDVKSTNYRFEQPLVFSHQELEFVQHTPNYHLYRIYDLAEEMIFPKIKVCEDCKILASQIMPHIQQLYNELNQKSVSLQMAKMVTEPTNNLFHFNSEIVLDFLGN